MLVKEIAEIYHCCTATISVYLDKFGIKKRIIRPWTSELNRKLKKKI